MFWHYMKPFIFVLVIFVILLFTVFFRACADSTHGPYYHSYYGHYPGFVYLGHGRAYYPRTRGIRGGK